MMMKGGEKVNKCNAEYAAKTAMKLAEENIKSTDLWVSSEQVIDFMEEIYNYMVTGEVPR